MDDQAIETEIQAKGKTAPRVTPDDVAANIHHIETVKHITQSGQVLRWSVLVTQSGFAVVGKPSVAVSPENDDAELGEQIAFDNSRDELWPLMGYALKQQLHDARPLHPVEQLAKDCGGTLSRMTMRPDGTGSATLSMPLPADHWLTKPGYDEPPMGFRKGTDDPERAEWVEKIRAAGRYAVRGATMNGEEADFDPDALVQNLVVGMLGYFTPTGLSSDTTTDTSGLPG